MGRSNRWEEDQSKKRTTEVAYEESNHQIENEEVNKISQ
jgi:hypothetical protein